MRDRFEGMMAMVGVEENGALILRMMYDSGMMSPDAFTFASIKLDGGLLSWGFFPVEMSLFHANRVSDVYDGLCNVIGYDHSRRFAEMTNPMKVLTAIDILGIPFVTIDKRGRYTLSLDDVLRAIEVNGGNI